MIMRKHKTITALGVLAAVAASGVTLASASGAPATTSGAPAPVTQLRTALPILAQPTSAADAIDVAARPETIPGASSAKRLALGSVPAKAWLSTDGALVCLTVQNADGAGTNCVTPDYAAANGIQLTLGGGTDGSPVTVAGVVPAGNDHVTLSTADGKTSNLPVRDNAFATVTTSSTTALAVGATSIPLKSYRG
jgi:hypothetical protein